MWLWRGTTEGAARGRREWVSILSQILTSSYFYNKQGASGLQSFHMQQARNIFIATISCLRSNTKAADLLRHFKNQLRMIKMKQARLDPEAVLKKYQTLISKYQRGVLPARPRGWHQNERRLFLWFLFAYYHLNYKKYSEITSKEWREFSECFGGKDVLLLRYEAVALERSSERVFWAPGEEALLRDLFKVSANGKWGDISRGLFFLSEGQFYKTSKQCREHWFNHLNTDIRKGGWTIEEDLAILTFVQNEGRHWSRLIDQIGRVRTEHMAKNRFGSLITLGRKYCNALSEVNQNDQNILIASLIEYLNTHRALLYDSNSPSSPEPLCKSDKSISIECPEMKEEAQAGEDKGELHPTVNRLTEQSILCVTDKNQVLLKDAANQEHYYNAEIAIKQNTVSPKRQKNEEKALNKHTNERQPYLYSQNYCQQGEEVLGGHLQTLPQQPILPQGQLPPQSQMLQGGPILLQNQNQSVNSLTQPVLYTLPASFTFSFNTIHVHPNMQIMQPFMINYMMPFAPAQQEEQQQRNDPPIE